MKKWIRKSIAGLSAGAMIAAGCMGAMPTSAIGLNSLKDSAFQYTITTEKVSSNQVKLTFHIVNNPGVRSLDFVIVSDDSCTYLSADVEAKGIFVPEANPETNRLFCTFLSSKVTNAEYGNIDFDIYYTISGNASVSHEFKFGICGYSSPNEPDVEVPSLGSDEVPNDAVVEVSPSVTVRIGDLNNDNSIDTFDAYYVLKMIDESASKSISTTYLDQQLQNPNSTWSKNYPFLKCAMVADVNRDTVIQEDDANGILRYCAEVGAGADVSNNYINTVCPVTVVYDGT